MPCNAGQEREGQPGGGSIPKAFLGKKKREESHDTG